MYFDILNGKKLDFPNSKEIKELVQRLDFDSFLDENNYNFYKSKKNLEDNINIFSEEDILRNINPKNEICYRLMNN